MFLTASRPDEELDWGGASGNPVRGTVVTALVCYKKRKMLLLGKGRQSQVMTR